MKGTFLLDDETGFPLLWIDVGSARNLVCFCEESEMERDGNCACQPAPEEPWRNVKL